jgi:hypothetical protein
VTSAPASRIGFALVSLCWVAAMAACAASVWRGEWKDFAVWVSRIPEILKHPGRRTAFLMPWLVPVAAGYVMTLSLGIFWGLRRREKMRR